MSLSCCSVGKGVLAGGTPQRALTDLAAIQRLHGFLARVLHLMRSQPSASTAADASQPARAVPVAAGSTALMWRLPGLAAVQVTSVGPTRAVLSVYRLEGEIPAEQDQEPDGRDTGLQAQEPLQRPKASLNALTSRWTFKQQDLFSLGSHIPALAGMDSLAPGGRCCARKAAGHVSSCGHHCS